MIDTSCDIKLVLIVDSTVPRLLKPSKCKRQFVKKLPSTVNRKSKRVIVVIALAVGLWLTNVQPAPAMGLSIPAASAAPMERIQPSYSHSSEVKTAPTVRPHLDKIVMMANNHNHHMIPLIYINEQFLKKLRAGDFSAHLTIVAISVAVYLMFQLSGVDAFGILDQISKWNAPQPSPGFGLAPTPTSTQTKAQKFNDMSSKFNQPQSQDVMSYDEAYNLVKETYGGSMQITKDCKITDWQGAKKAYHFQKGFDIDLSKYPNITKEDLLSLQNAEGGLISYVQKGGKLPPIELIRDGQQNIYDLRHLEKTEINWDVTHYSNNTGETPCIMFFNRETEQIALFNKTSGDLITADKFRTNYFKSCIESGQVGKPTN